MDYHKYRKYKQKYLTLKDQIGGNDYYFPGVESRDTLTTYTNKIPAGFIVRGVSIARGDDENIQDYIARLRRAGYRDISADMNALDFKNTMGEQTWAKRFGKMACKGFVKTQDSEEYLYLSDDDYGHEPFPGGYYSHPQQNPYRKVLARTTGHVCGTGRKNFSPCCLPGQYKLVLGHGREHYTTFRVPENTFVITFTHSGHAFPLHEGIDQEIIKFFTTRRFSKLYTKKDSTIAPTEIAREFIEFMRKEATRNMTLSPHDAGQRMNDIVIQFEGHYCSTVGNPCSIKCISRPVTQGRDNRLKPGQLGRSCAPPKYKSNGTDIKTIKLSDLIRNEGAGIYLINVCRTHSQFGPRPKMLSPKTPVLSGQEGLAPLLSPVLPGLDDMSGAGMRENRLASEIRRMKAAVTANKDGTDVTGIQEFRLLGDDLDKWVVVIEGPPGSPYEGRCFALELIFPDKYPMAPPKMRCATPLYHVNVAWDAERPVSAGQICMNVLNTYGATGYKLVMHVPDLVVAFLSLLGDNDPNAESPHNVEAGALINGGRKAEYFTKARELAQRYGIPCATPAV